MDLVAEFLSWEANRVVEAKVLMSRIMEVTIPLPTVLVRVSIVDMAAAALASVRAWLVISISKSQVLERAGEPQSRPGSRCLGKKHDS